MDVSTVSTDFLDLLKKFRSSVNQEIETLERSSEDMNVLIKTVDEVDSLLGSEGISLFVEQLKNMLETVTTDENNSVVIGSALETSNVEKSKGGAVDVQMKDVTKENTKFLGIEDMLKRKQDWTLQYARSLCNILKYILSVVTVDSNLGLLFYLDDLKPCKDTNMLADELHVYRRGNPDIEEISFKCYDDANGNMETHLELHTVIAKRIYKRMMKFITRHDHPKHQPHFSKIMWRYFTIRVNSVGESLLDIKARFSDAELPTLIDALKEEFNTDNAKDCHIHSLIITHPNQEFNTHVVFGSKHILEKMWNMSFIVNSSHLTSWNPVAMRNLSESLYKLAKPNKFETGMLMFELFIHSAVPLLCMADSCKNVVYIHPRNIVQKIMTFEASRNHMINFVCSTLNIQQARETFFSQCSEVCLVIGSLNKIRWKDVSLIINDDKVSKIIFLQAFENIFSTKKLANFCEYRHIKDPFIISRVVPIDSSPFREEVLILFLLERSSKLPGKLKENENFNLAAYNSFTDMQQKASLPFKEIIDKATGRARNPQIILEKLSAQLQAIQEIIRSQQPLKKTQQQAAGMTSVVPTLKEAQLKIEVSNTPYMKNVKQQNVDEISSSSLLKEAQMEAVDNPSKKPPLKKTLLQLVEEISSIPPLKKAPPQVIDQMSSIPSLKSQISQTPSAENLKIASVEKDLMSNVANKETTEYLKEEKRSANIIESRNEDIKFFTKYNVYDVDKDFLNDLNESEKMIMSLIIKETDKSDRENLDYYTAVNLKKELVNFEAKRLSDMLFPVLPQIITRASSGLTFQQMDMIECPSTSTLSEKYFIILDKNYKTGKILNTMDSNGKLIPLRHSMSNKAKNICKSAANFILKSKHPMFNEKGHGLWCMIIRINSQGNPWLMIEGNVDTDREAVWVLSNLVPKLKSFFLTGLGGKKAQDLQSVILSIVTRTSTESRIVFGDTMFRENAGPLHIKFHGKRFKYYNPYGMMGFANEIFKLAAVDRNWAVVQVGYGCGIESLKLAKDSAKFYLLRPPGPLDIYFFPDENFVHKGVFNYHPINHAEAMESVISNEVAYLPRVCVLYDLSETIGFFGASALRNHYNVKRILYVINPNNKDWLKEAVSCCQKRPDWEEPFVITKFVSVDMAPYDDNVRMICLLERESYVKRELKINDAFSEKIVDEFFSS